MHAIHQPLNENRTAWMSNTMELGLKAKVGSEPPMIQKKKMLTP